MDEEVLRLHALFQNLVPTFGLTHAKVCRALLNGEIKTAKQIGKESFISPNKVYGILKDLLQQKIVSTTNTNPASYHIPSPQKTFVRLVNQRISLLEKRIQEFGKIIENTASGGEKEYIIRIMGAQTKLFDNTTKAFVKEPQEAKQVVKQLSEYLKQLEPEKQYTYAAYK
ncbi:MAG: hypothetical protein HY917_05115 [Candidatus Diapherotrites archaeon]|nr:hypothetical protein [Candidatus Diapherotrites archaeon]